jgi:molybdate transport system regulatory protein
MSGFPKAILKVEFSAGLRLGPGKVRLLDCISETGSISAAARKMEMSYRRAWLLIEELNAMFGKPVVETSAGGSGGGGAKVTDFGKKVVGMFRDMERDTGAMVTARLIQLKRLDP